MAAVLHRTHSPAKCDSDSHEDSLEDMAKCVLSLENKFQWFDDVKREIEKRCGITTEHYWTDDDIRLAWEETQKMVKDYKRNQWAYVITFQEMKMFDDDDESDSTHSDLTECEQEEQPCSSATKKDPSDRPPQRVSERIIARKRRLEEDMSESKKARILAGSSPAIGIKIPLSELFGSEATSKQTETATSKYKLVHGYPSSKEIRREKTYVMSYDRNTKNAEWVYEILNKGTLAIKNNVKRKLSDFGKVAEYTRGHLVAAGNHRWCQKDDYGTYLFSNMSPQRSEMNRGVMKALEKVFHDQVTDINIRNVHVYTGPIIDSKSATQKSNGSDKAVPHSFFKVCIVENENGTVSEPKCYLIPNSDEFKARDYKESEDSSKNPVYKVGPVHLKNIQEYLQIVDIEKIERLSGLKFRSTDVQQYTDEIRSVTGEDGKEKSGCKF
ncbi:endonuclease G, mitochondrial-like [Danio aesculapii]|uniref:endonuclease G, mitochondrial-like n=1 Tax=Danio aesculapii TaxID=1142201 RepID=UPI0024BF1B10|nr:endonuclease G, mitochondrial-like [Danio aesculapii]